MATEGGDVAQIIETLSEQYSRSVNSGDTHWLADTFYDPDAYFLPPGFDMVRGSDQIRAVIDGMLQAGLGDFAMQTKKIDADQGMAYRIGYFTLGKPTQDHGKFIEVYRRQDDGSWKCVGDIFNSNRE